MFIVQIITCLSLSNRDDLENQLRGVTMERGSIRKSMVWCLDHADSAEEVRLISFYNVEQIEAD